MSAQNAPTPETQSKKWLKQVLSFLIKAGLTFAVFYLLLTHEITNAAGEKKRVLSAVAEHLGALSLGDVLPFLLAATGIKLVGIACSMLRWHLLLIGQGIRFNAGHIFGSFLLGRFLGTFLPGTVGLDGYKLYDAIRFSEKTVEPAAATALEKVMGLLGIFLTYLITLPLGMSIFPEHARSLAVGLSVPFATGIITVAFLVLFRPAIIQWVFNTVLKFSPQKLKFLVQRIARASAAYRGQGPLLAAVIGLSFLSHFLTAVMYWFTALALGAKGANFWEVTCASSIQILATVLSPFTIAGEGVREAVQAMFLASKIGFETSFLSGSLGFFAAEAMTLFGAIFLWTRWRNYWPKSLKVDGVQKSQEESGDVGGILPSVKRGPKKDADLNAA